MLKSLAELSTAQALSYYNNGQGLIIDIRSPDAYNGWAFRAEKRGGHIPNAKSLPFKWTKYMDWLDVVQSKGIYPENEILVYGYEKDQIEKVASMLVRAGYPNVNTYLNFLTEWVEDESLPLNSLERYKNLVSPEWVQSLIKDQQVPHYSNSKFKIIHAHYRNREAYLSGHIPGAIDMDTLAVESPETWNHRSPEELKKAFEEHGITKDTTVIVYGKFMSPDNDDAFPGSAAGHIGAIRTAMIMMYAGIDDVRVLNGGFQSWKDAGYEIEKDDVPKTPVTDFGADIPGRPEIIVDVGEAKQMIEGDDSDIVCVRSWPEYLGEVSGYNYIEKKGRIPGTVFGNCGSDAYHMENYRNPDHTIREFQEVIDIWEAVGIRPDKHLAFYCGTC